MEEKQDHIILFDGICNLCNGLVSFISKRDKGGKFIFLPLSSSRGQEELKANGLLNIGLDSIVYIDFGISYTRSTAALRILKGLGWPWKIFYAFIIIPKPIRDFIYDLIAKSRYRIFGTKHSCEIQ